jgi:hypothetical protein
VPPDPARRATAEPSPAASSLSSLAAAHPAALPSAAILFARSVPEAGAAIAADRGLESSRHLLALVRRGDVAPGGLGGSHCRNALLSALHVPQQRAAWTGGTGTSWTEPALPLRPATAGRRDGASRWCLLQA